MTEAAASLELDFRLTGAGWADLGLRVGEVRYEITGISYLTDALDDLIRLGIDIATARGFGFAMFAHEPGSTILFAETGWAEGSGWTSGRRISLIDWPESGREPTWGVLRDAPRLFMAEPASRDAIAVAILACAERVLATHGLEGYSKRWTGRLGFPSRGLAALRAALAVPADVTEGWRMDEMSGGCACGRVRYTVQVENDDAYLCHCRMCQRATGGVSIAFKNMTKADVAWEHEPDWYASSPIAHRPYCRECGTSLGFAFPDSENMDIAVGSFDDPSRFRPKHHFGAESLHRAWINTEGLPEYRTDEYKPLVDRWMEATGKVPD